jgi:hypothetical protein
VSRKKKKKGASTTNSERKGIGSEEEGVST